MKCEFLKPPVWEDAQGQPRKAGFEFELGNLAVEEIAEGLQRYFGGTLEKRSPFEILLKDTRLGRVKILRDTQLLTSLQYREWLETIGVDFSPGAEGELLEREVDKLSRWLVPCEIVTDPLQFEQFPLLDELVRLLETHEAQGTQKALHYAFGLHINPAAPNLDSATLLAYLQAFVLVVEWIIQDAQTDLTRRFLTNYIDPFPQVYVRKILQAEYQPDVDTLVGDYLEYNATRNRPLDMLPIFCLLLPEKVSATINRNEQGLVKGRPAFHYRLPDCRVGKHNWRIADEWNRWYIVEVLAHHQALRQELLTLWVKEQKTLSLLPHVHWAQQVDKFIQEHKLLSSATQ